MKLVYNEHICLVPISITWIHIWLSYNESCLYQIKYAGRKGFVIAKFYFNCQQLATYLDIGHVADSQCHSAAQSQRPEKLWGTWWVCRSDVWHHRGFHYIAPLVGWHTVSCIHLMLHYKWPRRSYSPLLTWTSARWCWNNHRRCPHSLVDESIGQHYKYYIYR